MNPQDEEFIASIESQAYEQGRVDNQGGQHSIFGGEHEQNLIEQQLNLDDVLERVDHLLRGHILEERNGKIDWYPAKDENMKLFNDHGVGMLMNIMSFYLNRNTILSHYSSEDMINIKMSDIGEEIADVIFLNYERMFYMPDVPKCVEILKDNIKEAKQRAIATFNMTGRKVQHGYEYLTDKSIAADTLKMRIDKEIDTIRYEVIRKKITLYSITVNLLVNTIHSAYLRALRGGERESIRTSRTVTQHGPVGGDSHQYPGLAQRRSLFGGR